MNFRSFANPEYYVQTTAKRVACIDTTKKDYGPILSHFVAGSINEYLSVTLQSFATLIGLTAMNLRKTRQ